MQFIDINNRIYGLGHFALLVAQKEREHFLLLVICTLCVQISYCQKKKIILLLIDEPVTTLHVQDQGREFDLHHACLGRWRCSGLFKTFISVQGKKQLNLLIVCLRRSVK